MNAFSLGIPLRRSFGMLFLLLLLVGCETLPEDTYTTSGGCGIAQFRKEWWSANVKEMSWSGPCEGGLASGPGNFVMRFNNGKEQRYNGAMSLGWMEGEGERTSTDGWRMVGDFIRGDFFAGKIFTPKGQLRFDGIMHSSHKDPAGNTISLSQQRFGTGTLYLLDAAETKIENATFDGTSGLYAGARSVNPDTGGGFMIGTVVRKGQAPTYFIEGKKYDTETFAHASAARLDRIYKQSQVEAEKQQREAQEIQRQQALAEQRIRTLATTPQKQAVPVNSLSKADFSSVCIRNFTKIWDTLKAQEAPIYPGIDSARTDAASLLVQVLAPCAGYDRDAAGKLKDWQWSCPRMSGHSLFAM